VHVESRRAGPPMENAEFAALVLLGQDWDSIAEWLLELLFEDDANRMAFRALADADGDLRLAIEQAPPEAREVLERVAVADLELDSEVEAKTLIGAAARRELRERTRLTDPAAIEEDRRARLDLDALNDVDRDRGRLAAESLLTWLDRRAEERSGGDG
jgi:DNA primase